MSSGEQAPRLAVPVPAERTAARGARLGAPPATEGLGPVAATGVPPAATATATAASPAAGPGSGAPLPNRRPQARGDTAATTAGVSVAVVVTANDSDPDNDPLKIKDVRQPRHGTATCAPVDPQAFRPQ